MIKIFTTLPPFYTNMKKPGSDVKFTSKISITVKERFSVRCVPFERLDGNFMMALDRKPFRIKERAFK